MSASPNATGDGRQPFVGDFRCTACGGARDDPQGQGTRCWGFRSSDGEYNHCTREEYAGGIPFNANSKTYPHKVNGPCLCGRTHGYGFVATPPPATAPAKGKGKGKTRDWGPVVASYDFPYPDEQGRVYYREMRNEHLNAEGKKAKRTWIEALQEDKSAAAGHPVFEGFPGCMRGIRLIPFDLPALLAAPADETVFIVEGPKKAWALQRLGLVATTNPYGAGSWKPGYAEHFRGRRVVILPDENDVGRKHAQDVARSLHGIAAEERVVPLPGLAEREDIVDWLAKGGTPDQLRALVADAPAWEPEPTSAPVALGVVAPDLPAPASPVVEEVRKVIQFGGAAGVLGDPDLMGRIASSDSLTLATVKFELRGDRRFSPREFQKAVDELRPSPAPAEGAALIRPIYKAIDGCLAYLDPEDEGAGFRQLANFDVRIVEEEIRDNGDAQARRFKIRGATRDGHPLAADVDASAFDAMAWVSKQFGQSAIIAAGRGLKDHARAGIQELSGVVSRRVVYTHTGWREISPGRFVYLHAGGAIGPDGLDDSVSVDLRDHGLVGYALPAPPEGDDFKAAARASLGILRLAQGGRPGSTAAAALIVCQAYRAALGGTRHTVQFSGPTGAFKSCLAALILQHFAPSLDYNRMPLGFNSTSAATGVIRALLADSCLVVDDFVPGGTRQDRAKADREGEDLLRSQGNGVGRRRMNPDGTLQKLADPKSALVITGEERVTRASANARTLGVWVENDSPSAGTHGTVDPEILTRCQADAAAGLYAGSMSAFVRHLAADLPRHREVMQARAAEYRELATRPGDHGRTPDIVATLAAGFMAFLEFATAAGSISPADMEHCWSLVWDGLMEAADQIRQDQSSSVDPASRFLSLVGASLSSKASYLADASGGKAPKGIEEACGWSEDSRYLGSSAGSMDVWDHGPNARQIGWADREFVYLEPEAAYNAAQAMLASRGDSLPAPLSLHRLLDSAGKLARKDARTDKPRLTARVSIAKKQRTVLVIRAADVIGDDEQAGEEVEGPILPFSAEDVA